MPAASSDVGGICAASDNSQAQPPPGGKKSIKAKTTKKEKGKRNLPQRSPFSNFIFYSEVGK